MKKFKEPSGLNDVSEFHETFDMPIGEEPIIPSEDRCGLRVNLIQEELNELKDAIADNDIVEVADALCDLQYVLSGAILEFGLASQFADLFSEVHRSNMSKVCKSLKEAKETQEHYKNGKNTESVVVEKSGDYLVYRKGDQKVLKSVKYSPANIKGMLEDNSNR